MEGRYQKGNRLGRSTGQPLQACPIRLLHLVVYYPLVLAPTPLPKPQDLVPIALHTTHPMRGRVRLMP